VGNWSIERGEPRPLGGKRTARTVVYRDVDTGLSVRVEGVEYADFSAVEWTVFLRNDGARDTPIIEGLQSLATRLALPSAGSVVVHHAVGSPATAADYAPRETVLRLRSEASLGGKGGRPSDTDLPYFNLAWDGGGVVVAVGWPGQWSARLFRDGEGAVEVVAGQELTHFTLHPGEEVRAPLIALVFYAGDWIAGQNAWRRWLLAHNLPRIAGALPAPFLTAGSSNQFHEMEQANEANQVEFLDGYLAEEINLDYWWMDAGWYVLNTGQWTATGTWEVDRQRFPHGLRAISDHAHERGVKCLVWFEPERVAPDTWLDRNHPEWLLALAGRRWKILDLGNPAARHWVVETYSRLIRDEGIDLYRQDFNVAPLDYWRAADEPDRQGISEIRHVTGYLAFWDELRQRFPDMLLDTCASGGRRLDLETLRRSVPLHKSDHDYRDHEARQSQAYGIALWIPFHGAPVCKIDAVDPYAFRSAVGLMVGLGYDVRRRDLDYALLRRLTAEWRQIAPFYYGDYYPLTSHSVDPRDWLAWQYHRPEQNAGIVQVFRRSESPYVAARFPLRGLDPAATYRLTNLDDSSVLELSGEALLRGGLPVNLEERSSAAIFTYEGGDRT
jgi:alpha-galactosidase